MDEALSRARPPHRRFLTGTKLTGTEPRDSV